MNVPKNMESGCDFAIGLVGADAAHSFVSTSKGAQTAKADADSRSARAQSMGLKARYEVVKRSDCTFV